MKNFVQCSCCSPRLSALATQYHSHSQNIIFWTSNPNNYYILVVSARWTHMLCGSLLYVLGKVNNKYLVHFLSNIKNNNKRTLSTVGQYGLRSYLIKTLIVFLTHSLFIFFRSMVVGYEKNMIF
jgi:hypothetical protein